MAKRPIVKKKSATTVRRGRLSLWVRDESIDIPKGETCYTIDLDLKTVEALERGRCPEALSNRMHALLKWRRDAIRATADHEVSKTR